MTERKIEVLVHDVLLAKESLEESLQSYQVTQTGFFRLHKEMMTFIKLIEQISLSQDEVRKKEVEKFSEEIAKQVERYKTALKSVTIDTTQIEAKLDHTHRSIHGMVEKIDESAELIAETVDENGREVIAAAEKIKRRKGDLLWRTVFFGMGIVVGGLFLAAYPIASAAKHFHNELLVRDKQTQQLKEQYEINDKTLHFLRKHDIVMRHNTTDKSWKKPSLRYAPMITFPIRRILKIDKVNGHRRIIFTKQEK